MADRGGAVERAAEGPQPGVMHPIDEAFYKLTVGQRDRAWARNERLEAKLKAAEEENARLRRTLSQLELEFARRRVAAWPALSGGPGSEEEGHG